MTTVVYGSPEYRAGLERLRAGEITKISLGSSTVKGSYDDDGALGDGRSGRVSVVGPIFGRGAA